jgi:predicted metal-binding protein
VPDPTTLYVCTTCRSPDDAPDGPRGGARLLAALRAERDARPEAAMQAAVRIEPVECLSVCKRPCTVAVASAERWTYVYGDLDAATSARTILDGLALYAGTPDGIVPWRERPEAFRKGVVARIPPFPARPAE